MLTDEIVEDVRKALEATGSVSVSSALSGVPRRTWYDWLRRGVQAEREAEEGGELSANQRLYATFSHTVKQAVARFKWRAITEIRGSGEWTALMTLLERQYPDEYGRRERTDHVHTGGLVVEVAAVPGAGRSAALIKGTKGEIDAGASEGDPEIRGLLPPPERTSE